MEFPKKSFLKLKERKNNNLFRVLGQKNDLVDFSSNDYLGFATSETIFYSAHNYLIQHNIKQNGSSGSRLLSGNHNLFTSTEVQIAKIHKTDAALIYNSGYAANIGLLSAVPQRHDIVLFDELVHASIRAGLSISNAKSYKFKHNNLEALEALLKRFTFADKDIYIVTESVFSMDGNSPDLNGVANLCKAYNAHLIIDEAHAIGVFNTGLVEQLNLESFVFARIVTFGKAMGCHGAAVLGSKTLKEFLINFSGSFIYTTALPPHSLATINQAYKELSNTNQIKKLKENIRFFKSQLVQLNLQYLFIESNSAIHSAIIPTNEKVKKVSQHLLSEGFDVKPILSPTVPEGKERLRFCLHSYNTQQNIADVLNSLANFVNTK